jgi:hypothetical protein
MKLAMIAKRNWTDERKQQFESFVAEIQLYGTPRQIELAIGVVKAFIDRKLEISLDPLLEELRDSLRKELRMEPVKGSVWWYRFTLPEWARKEPAKKINDGPTESQK